ncbi:MAG: hypothetical protein QGG90_09980, partial [Nitrospinota bacterium]|nr:hypothetical protein [Nitrospinota bacterium]
MITVSLAGDVAEGSLRTIARDLKEDFRRIPGVAAVRIIGARNAGQRRELRAPLVEEESIALAAAERHAETDAHRLGLRK